MKVWYVCRSRITRGYEVSEDFIVRPVAYY